MSCVSIPQALFPNNIHQLLRTGHLSGRLPQALARLRRIDHQEFRLLALDNFSGAEFGTGSAQASAAECCEGGREAASVETG